MGTRHGLVQTHRAIIMSSGKKGTVRAESNTENFS